MRELGVAALSPFMNRKVLNDDVPRTFSRSIRVHHVDGGHVIFIQQGRPRWWGTCMLEAMEWVSLYMEAIVET
jgi:hypothetical protein